MWFIFENNFKSIQTTIGISWMLWFIISVISLSFIDELMDKIKNFNRRGCCAFVLQIFLCFFVISSICGFESIVGLIICTIILNSKDNQMFNTYKFTYSSLSKMTVPTEVLDEDTLERKIVDVVYIVAKYFMTNNNENTCYQIQGQDGFKTNDELNELDKSLQGSHERD